MSFGVRGQAATGLGCRMMVRLTALVLMAGVGLAQDLSKVPPFFCQKVTPSQRGTPLEVTIPTIQTTVQTGPLPSLSNDICLHTAKTAASAGHTFPSALAGKYVTIRNVLVTASGLNKNDKGKYWFAVQPLSGGVAHAGLEVYSETYVRRPQPQAMCPARLVLLRAAG